MASQGRKRTPNRTAAAPEEAALNVIAKEAEARLAAKRAARAEAREIRMKELERQQKEVSDDEECMSVGTRSSVREIHELKDQIHDVEAKYMQSFKELKDSLAEMELKYRKAMVSNAQLDNEKSNLMYEVDTLKDSLMELEEFLAETRRECEEKTKELEREKHAHSILQFQFSEQKETLKQSEELLTEIRHLHFKQEGFVREISDLQETVQWKDKKIGALERQKEFSDAIRNERDELRDEVVQLKDILKKHGIVLGPDLCPNGEVEENAPGGSACSVLPQGSSVLGTQELQLFKDENVGGSRSVQFQTSQDFHHGMQENHLPPSSSDSSSNPYLEAQNEDGGLGNCLNNTIEKMNDVGKLQNVCEVVAEEQVLLEISKGSVALEPVIVNTEGTVTDQQESPLYVERSETIKEANPDFTEKFTCEILEKDNTDETLCGDSQIKMASDSLPSAKVDMSPHSQSASASGKKKKKKKKNKQRRKHSCDEKDVHSEIGEENENQLTESHSVQPAMYNSISLEEAPMNGKEPEKMNTDEVIGLMPKGGESLEVQNPSTGPGTISAPIVGLTDCLSSTASIPLVDSKTEINIDIPTYGIPLQSTVGELKASDQNVNRTAADTHLDETLLTAKVPEEGQETSADTHLDETLLTAKVPEEGQETSADTHLDETLVTAKLTEEEQETSADAHLDETLATAKLTEEEQETSVATHLNEVPEKEQESWGPAHMDQEFKVEKEAEMDESFEFNMVSNESLLRETECLQEDKSIATNTEQNCTTSEGHDLPDTEDRPENQMLQTDIQSVSSVQRTTTGGTQNKCQQQFITGNEEQGSQDHEEILHFEQSESAKKETSPAHNIQVLDDEPLETGEVDQKANSIIPQEEGQNLKGQEVREVREVREGASERNKVDAKNGSKREGKKGKGKTKEDCKMS